MVWKELKKPQASKGMRLFGFLDQPRLGITASSSVVGF